MSECRSLFSVSQIVKDLLCHDIHFDHFATVVGMNLFILIKTVAAHFAGGLDPCPPHISKGF